MVLQNRPFNYGDRGKVIVDILNLEYSAIKTCYSNAIFDAIL